MTSAWSQLEQMLTCAICLDKFKNPRLLPCQHSFCGDACMDGLVDYARRQIKCPECRAEHRIPYQGVSSLPSNVTLIRFLELHSRITGEEPEPVPTFMEKCSVCSEKVEGVQRCAHCEKKVCPECKEAHLDILRRDLGRINGQVKRCLGKMQEFRETLDKSGERLQLNEASVRREIEQSCKRLIDDLQAKQRRLLDELEAFAEQERRTIGKLKVAVKDELELLESNSRLADEKLGNGKLSWTDGELSELKEIYTRAMEFVRLFDPEIGDYSRKMRFLLIPEFETLRRRLCELGELKFSETADALMASSLQYCNATGSVALELCQSAAAQAAAQAAAGAHGAGGYNLSHSNSNSQLGSSSAVPSMLELPSMQNALMRSQSDHRLASQFQARLKQQQQEAAAGAKNGARYGAGGRDYETESLRSRYGPGPRGSITGKDYASELTRDWPRPSDSDAPDLSFGSSIQFKSAFMRRKEKERQAYHSNYQDNDDDDLASEASYGAGRNVRFQEPGASGADVGPGKAPAKLFDLREVEHAPLSGVPKLEDCPHLLARLHQMGARASVDRKRAEEEGRRDQDLVESARQAMSKASERAKTQRQQSEDEVEKQKRANKQQASGSAAPVAPAAPVASEPARADSPEHSVTPTAELTSAASTVVEAEPSRPADTTPPSPAAGGRRSLYGQAVTEKSRRQLSSAIQDAAAYTRRRAAGSSQDDGSTPEASGSSQVGTRPKRTLRSSGRSLSKQSSLEQSGEGAGSRRRKTLTRADSSQEAAVPETHSKNSATGSGGQSDTSQSSQQESLAAGPQLAARRGAQRPAPAPAADQTSTTTDDEAEPEEGSRPTSRRSADAGRSSADFGTGASNNAPSDNEEPDDDDADNDGHAGYGARNRHRASREMLPNAVNKLLDRSAQIRRDSQEQRSRADSPQRTLPARTASSTSSYYRSGGSASGSGYSSPSASRQRLAYQRSQSIRDSQLEADEASNSNNSIYTTASSGSQAGRRSSHEDELSGSLSSASARRLSGNSTDRTLTGELGAGRPAYRRDSSTDSAPTGGYQSRFLARSRTSAALSGAGSSARSQDEREADERLESPRGSYLSSRDRFMQSANVASPTSAASSAVGGVYSARPSGSSAALAPVVAGLGQYRHQPASQAHYSDNSPFIEVDDEDDNDQYGAYFPSAASPSRSSPFSFYAGPATKHPLIQKYLYYPLRATTGTPDQDKELPRSHYGKLSSGGGQRAELKTVAASAGVKSHSEYLRNKFNRRGSSNSTSSTSSALLRSRSSHTFARDSDEATDDDNDEISGGLAGDRPSGRRSSTADWSPYASKRRMLFKLGSRGSDPSNFTWPRGVAVGVGAVGREIVVADSSNHRVQIFDSSGNFLHEFGQYGSGPSEFDCLAGVAIDRVNGRYVVSDRYNHRVQLFDLKGRHVRSFGELGREPGKFNLPWGVACDSAGLIYVCDKENHRVQVFDHSGQLVSKFGSGGREPGQMQHPHYIAVGISKLAVTDTNNHRVQLFDLSGRLLSSIGSEGSQEGQFKFPRGVAMDERGYIIVGDSGNNRLQIFTPDGLFLKAIGSWGSANGEFKGIEGVAVDASHNILVCDRENHRIQVF